MGMSDNFISFGRDVGGRFVGWYFVRHWKVGWESARNTALDLMQRVFIEQMARVH